ncbi:MAG: formylmethanofuran--tetrahydromethanopterin N-formyltransferase [Archaeoglobi archaeon]|nr:formylmethanofuran--tetrahydromethanopterin N-formyltransferase [Candidatus Mnemosynella sp.]
MQINGVEIEETYAEAFPMYLSRLIITAATKRWAIEAAREATGFATSIIGCPAEAGIERELSPQETPDGRPGVSILICHVSKKKLKEQVLERAGNCILTAPTCSLFNGLESEDSFEIKLRYFGDGFERKIERYGRELWAIPIMSGEFVYEERIGFKAGVGGGNFLILSRDSASGLLAAEAAVDAISKVDGVITPFVGGVVSAGSKVGSRKYKFMKATTNERFCPTLREEVESALSENIGAVHEIVINGLSEDDIKRAMREGIEAATRVEGVIKISAGNYGGNLGKYLINLHELW